MTKEEAIRILYSIDNADEMDEEFAEAYNMAIKALEQQPCEDAISRQIISDYVGSHIQEINTGYGDLNEHTNRILRMIVDYIDKMESVTPQLTEEQIQKMQELEQAEIQKAYELGKAEMQPCEDAISRQAVIKYICESKECYKDDCKGRLYKRCYDLQWIYDLPSVTPQLTEEQIQKMQEIEQAEIQKAYELGKAEQPKIGHWIYIGNSDVNGLKICECDVCGKRTYGSHAFCPNCGIKMESEG